VALARGPGRVALAKPPALSELCDILMTLKRHALMYSELDSFGSSTAPGQL